MTYDPPFPKVIKKKNDHDRGCACRSCIGRRNRRSGLDKQRKAARAAGVKPRRQGDLSNEERFPRTGLAEKFKLEHKSGNLSKFILDAIAQIERDRAIGDPRPPLVQLTPKGSTTVYVLLSQDDLLSTIENSGPDSAFAIRDLARAVGRLAKEIEGKAG